MASWWPSGAFYPLFFGSGVPFIRWPTQQKGALGRRWFLGYRGILQFVLTGNFAFAAAGAGIFIWSAWQQIRRGAIQQGLKAVVESVSQGDSTELMSLMLLSEKSVEAPLQLMLQFYAFVFVTSSEFAVVSFVASIIMSSISVSQAVHSLIFLGGAEKLMAKEYAPLT